MVPEEAERILRLLSVRNLGRSRQWVVAPCPLAPWTHKSGRDSNPSFGVYAPKIGKSHFFCQGCKHSGSVGELALMLGKLREENYTDIMLDAVRTEARGGLGAFEQQLDEGVQLVALDERVYGDLYPEVETSDDAWSFLSSRAIRELACERLDLRFDPDKHRVLFPVRDRQGDLYGYSGRAISDNIEPKVRDYLGLPKQHMLFGAQHMADRPILLVEGLTGVARAIQSGAEEWFQPVAVMGSTLTQHQAETLQDHGEAVYLMPDLDDAGEAFLYGPLVDGRHQGNGAIDKLRQHVPLLLITYPEHLTDIDQFEQPDWRDAHKHAELLT